MPDNLLLSIQTNLGYGSLQKVNPNTQDIENKNLTPEGTLFAQAAIPTVLIGLYKYTADDKAAEEILHHTASPGDWISKIFGNQKDDVIHKIVSYAGTSHAETSRKLEEVAYEAILLIHQYLPEENKVAAIKELLSAQKHEILSYLPGPLHIGEMLDHTAIDDNTNKMEGPVSNIAHKISDTFSKLVTDKEQKDKE